MKNDVSILLGDCLNLMEHIPDGSVDIEEAKKVYV